MAGRPGTMARRVSQLYDRLCEMEEQLQQLMPQQYEKPTDDKLGKMWQAAVHAVAVADDFFCDLSSYLDYEADQTNQRACSRPEASAECQQQDRAATANVVK